MSKKQKKKPDAKPVPTRQFDQSLPFERHAFWLAVVVLAVLLISFFNPIFFADKSFSAPDNIASQAHQTYLQESYSQPGGWLDKYPLWTPYIFSGMPSLGSLIAAPYTNPMSLLLSWVPANIKLVLYYFLLGLFTWLFLRLKGVSGLAATFGAVSYIFCAHLITLIMFGHNSKIATLMYLPLILGATVVLWERPSLKWASLLGLGVGTMMLTSHVQIAYYTLLAAGLYLLLATIQSLREKLGAIGVLKRWGVWIVSTAVGLAASAVVYLPVREYAKYSIRGGTEGGLPYEYATSWSLHPTEILTFFVPSLAGFGGNTYWGRMPFTDFPHYMGILPLFLAVLALVWIRWNRVTVYLAVLGVLSLVVSFGNHVPVLYDLFFNYLPFFNKFRVPVMILVLFQFAVAVLAAFGLDTLIKRGSPSPQDVKKFLGVTAAFALVLAGTGAFVMSGLEAQASSVLAERLQSQGAPAQVAQASARLAADVVDMSKADLLRVLFVLALGAALVWARLKGRLGNLAVGAGILILTVFDLWVVDQKPAQYHDKGSSAAAFAPSPEIDYLQKQPGHFRVLPLSANNNTYAYFSLSSILGYHPAKLKVYQDLIEERGPLGVGKLLQQRNYNILDMLNTRYVIANPQLVPLFTAEGRFKQVFAGNEAVLENQFALPRMFFVDRVTSLPNEAAVMQRMAQPSWNPKEEALVSASVEPVQPGMGGSATITKYTPRHIEAQLESPGNSFLVLSEVYFPAGWEHRIDGELVPVMQTNHALRGLVVPPGSHTLSLEFNPGSFRNGAVLSVSMYLVLTLGLASAWFVERRRGGSSGTPPKTSVETAV